MPKCLRLPLSSRHVIKNFSYFEYQERTLLVIRDIHPEMSTKVLSLISRSSPGPFKMFIVVMAGAVLQLSTVRCDSDRAEFRLDRCHAAAREGGGDSTPGLCVPVTWCPHVEAEVPRDDRPSPCGVREGTLLECCPTADVVKPAPADIGCGAAVNDPRGLYREPIKEGLTPAGSPWPWMAAIFKGNEFICGGSLLDADTVLTAAQCFYELKNNTDAQSKAVLSGINLLRTNMAAINTPGMKVLCCQGYRVGRINNDIALVKTVTKAPYGSHIRPVCLPQPDFELSGPVIVIGWGHAVFGGSLSNRLQERQALVISNEKCDEIMRQSPTFPKFAPEGITEGIVCAHNETGVDACQGDSGGPMLAQGADSRWNVVGVVSFGIGCGGRYPGGYTRVTAFLDWIARNRH
ncbi:hypothetical protein HPB50_020923 [Hyalomma asiaticum]|uniref:Uncharacterized protein n=1 Tax=Hyalomma asiaticum TaxID=266040 RepID=A0ACB7SRZ9_HYAAI|nr:hypothetical protein HPB50_020923 [Hyalomma asiaticum]